MRVLQTCAAHFIDSEFHCQFTSPVETHAFAIHPRLAYPDLGRRPRNDIMSKPDLHFLLEPYVERVNAALDDFLPPASERPMRLHEAIRYSVFPGGKRIRPVLCLAAAESVNHGEAPPLALSAAAAVELLHTYTLVHDDLPCMDNDELRRGMPTVHVAYGEAMAVLVGDALQTMAFEALGSGPADGADCRAQLVCELSRATGSRGVIGGQVEDIEMPEDIDEDDVIFVHQHKTADLFRASLHMGAIAANASEQQLDALGRYGMALGMAFQITDDLLDAAQDSGQGDETPGLTCLSVYDVETARLKARNQIELAIAALEDLAPPDGVPLEAIVGSLIDRTK